MVPTPHKWEKDENDVDIDCTVLTTFFQKIKSEPKSDGTDDMDFDNDDDDGDGSEADLSLSVNNGIPTPIPAEVNHDPLSNGVTAVTSEIHLFKMHFFTRLIEAKVELNVLYFSGLFNQAEHKEIDKLRMELLNYELETAKVKCL